MVNYRLISLALTLKDYPMSGHVFIFRGCSGSQVKLLWFTGDGLCLLAGTRPLRLAEQEALNRALLEKLAECEREIDHLQSQLDKLRRMNYGSRSEKVSRRIAQIEADLSQLQTESDALTGQENRRMMPLHRQKRTAGNTNG